MKIDFFVTFWKCFLKNFAQNFFCVENFRKMVQFQLQFSWDRTFLHYILKWEKNFSAYFIAYYYRVWAVDYENTKKIGLLFLKCWARAKTRLIFFDFETSITFYWINKNFPNFWYVVSLVMGYILCQYIDSLGPHLMHPLL